MTAQPRSDYDPLAMALATLLAGWWRERHGTTDMVVKSGATRKER